MIIPQASINVLPLVGNQIQVYFTVIDTDNSLNEVTIDSLTLMYGNLEFTQPNLFKPLDNLGNAILVKATYNSIQYASILYVKAIYGPQKANNFSRIIQKIPLGIFTDINSDTIIGNDMQARADMFNDAGLIYLEIVQQVYSTQYSPQLEFEYNNTIGLLSNSVYPEQLFLAFARLATVRLINYDLELFISQYIYYRLGAPVSGDGYAVYINDHIDSSSDYWNLGIPGNTELGSTTILAPNNFNPVLQNLQWKVFNAASFTPEFKEEIANLIVRISRADMGNPVTFSNAITPVDEGFTLIGPTYPNDPRLIDDRCLEYIGNPAYPLNIIGYKAPNV